MTALRIFPFVGALIAIAAVVLAIVGVSTTYWFSNAVNTHTGRKKYKNSILKEENPIL